MCFSTLALVLASCASTTNVPAANTRAQIVRYVDRAAAVVAKNGPSCTTFSSPEWKSGDWYIFVLEPNGKTICHPVRPELVGTSVADLVDPNGKRVGAEFVSAATAHPAGGWVDYVWPRPGQTAPVAKSSYVRLVTAPDGKPYIVGSGGYELK